MSVPNAIFVAASGDMLGNLNDAEVEVGILILEDRR